MTEVLRNMQEEGSQTGESDLGNDDKVFVIFVDQSVVLAH